MGLTNDSTGKNLLDGTFTVLKEDPSDLVIALAGNPNVGKSTVFNELTGLNQHTGNWPGKTVGIAQGSCRYHDKSYIFVDLPGTYSLMAHSAEEEIARDFLLFGGADAAVVVCDATCLERNLNLVLQTMEITPHVVLCVNLMDEAKKKGILIDLSKLKELLQIPVVGTSARSGKGLDQLLRETEITAAGKENKRAKDIRYPDVLEEAARIVESSLEQENIADINLHWLSIRLLERNPVFLTTLKENIGYDLLKNPAVASALFDASLLLEENQIDTGKIQDMIAASLVAEAETVYTAAAKVPDRKGLDRDRRLDRILTSKRTGIPIMLLMLCVIFWLTISASNVPSELLATGLFWVQDRLTDFFSWLGTPEWVHGVLVLGIYRVLAWVVSVMLPPMAIFFPMFTFLEDFGYLPRVAFVLDHHFKKACACGKQALTMCMGFGCNAAGVVGCRIIDSPRERLIAILTNNFVPCNGRFPLLITVATMFFVGTRGGFFGSVLSALILTGVILLGVFLTFWVSRILSKTILKGEPSSFSLELPPYRTPQLGKILVRSLLDRTIFVLGRAIVAAIPAGLIIWIFANVTIGDATILAHFSSFLDPFGRLLGLDGVILLAFILGFPANEIVIPIMIMAYLSTGTLLELDTLAELKTLLVDNGWTWLTAVSTMLFCLIHWPCSTTCMTIKKETGSFKWTVASFAIPTAVGMIVCFLFATAVRLLGLV